MKGARVIRKHIKAFRRYIYRAECACGYVGKWRSRKQARAAASSHVCGVVHHFHG